ncbi:MAG: glycosyltransferase family 9 protein [Gammaproteobacteria bacterium]|nr:glycosyltransferase family 9 protein [Gammaproteobacteria bacterium]
MKIERVLLVRNDKIGDFVLSLPAIKMLRESFPSCHISVLVSGYTQDIAKSVDYIDEVIIDSEKQSAFELASLLKPYQFDAVITLFSSYHVALACFLLRLPLRIAPATKIFQFLYNSRLVQRRSQSLKPEYEYNQDLVSYFLQKQKIKQTQVKPPFLQTDKALKQQIRDEFCNDFKLNQSKKIVFIHPGCGGSAKNLSANQFSILAKSLAENGLQVVLTAGPGETELVAEVSANLTTPHTVYHSKKGLLAFMQLISVADLFIGGSTGPLHIAGAYDVKTVGFYPRRRSATSLRWKTLNSEQNLMSFSPPDDCAEEDMGSIDMHKVVQLILEKK